MFSYEQLSLNELSQNIIEIKVELNRSDLSEISKARNRKILDELIPIFERKAKVHLEAYGNILRPVHVELIKRLKAAYERNPQDLLIRRAYVAAFFGICILKVLEREEFQDLKEHFQKMKLPLVVSPDDLDLYDSTNFDSAPLSHLTPKFMDIYRETRSGKPEENLKTLWFPVLQAFITSAKEIHGCDDMFLIAEYATKNIEDYAERRYIDYVIGDVEGGKPILLVEMAADPVNEDQLHKDFRTMALTMAHILMDLVGNAEVHCPDDDISKFRIYGLLIGGSVFECCVGSVLKTAEGKISFVFHSNSKNWKFDLFGGKSAVPMEANEWICAGKESVEVIRNLDFSSAGPFLATILSDIGLFELMNDTEKLPEKGSGDSAPEDISMDGSPGAEIVLWKFICDIFHYYTGLPECLKFCIKTTSTAADDLTTYAFPPAAVRPRISTSSSSHSGTSGQETPSSKILDFIPSNRSQAQIYGYLSSSKYQTLPDVIIFNPESNFAILRIYTKNVDIFSEDVKKAFEAKQLEIHHLALLVSKFILDLVLAAHHLHSKGYVIGNCEPKYIASDGVFWRLQSLSRLTTVSEAPGVNVNTLPNFEPDYHIEAAEQRLSQRDDIYGIAKSARRGLRNHLGTMIRDRRLIPLFEKFLDSGYEKMLKVSEYPELSTSELLTNLLPLYEQMIQQYSPSITRSMTATKVLGKHSVQAFEESSQESGTSVEVNPISMSGNK